MRTAYGECTVESSSVIGTQNPFRFKGYYFDTESGMYCIGSRYYVPEWCRWLNADDPAYLDFFNPSCINLFAYCGNDPIGRVIPISNLCAGISSEFNPYGFVDRGNLPAIPWLVGNATTIYGSLSSISAGTPILLHYLKYASTINDEFKLYGISKWGTSLQLSNISFKMGCLDGVLIGVNVLIDIYDSYQRGISTQGIIWGGTLTAASGVGMFYLNKGIMWTATTIGTAICPGIGTGIGFCVGLVASILVDIFLGGWIADKIDENIK